MENGNYIVLRDGSTCVRTTIRGKHYLIDVQKGTFLDEIKFEDYNYTPSSEFDVIKVYEDYTMSELLWERKDTLTEEEKQYLKTIIAPLTCPVKYIHKGVSAISIILADDDFIDLSLYKNLKFTFEGLVEDCKYTLEELGVC